MTWVQDSINYGIGWCFSCGLGTGFYGDSDVITLGIYDVIELGLSYWDLYGCIYGNIESLVIGFQYFINADVGWCVSGCLGTGFGIDVDLITLGIDEVIQLGFWDRYFEFVNNRNFECLVT